MSSPSPPIALVTAGSAGLGACVAELFARNGMRVIVNYASNIQRAEDLVTKLKSISTLTPVPGRVDYHAIKADLGSRADVERLVEESVSAMCPGGEKRRLDVVFSNGGWTQMRNLYDLEDNMVDEDWDMCFLINVKSHLWLMHAAKPYLEAGWGEDEGGAHESGCFITTASLAGVKVSGSSLAYAVTKAAQLHLAKGLAMLAAPKIRVNSVSPGLLLTEWGLRFPPERIQAMTEASKLKRLAAVEDVAEQVLTFVKNKSVTGQNMVLDGGLSL
ncbi:short-chain dehydrogenase [Diaporthe amygdali]|uniref:short-chain dehydrogenase n=1 Tax=Phomopsis amygdali TaxID=1214568 RepID=UPI0022FE8231|nr:short-chain dehydrogenase [Diaporthe amygdali]KAJ0121409.1 short-chain dehydrogenase [Diaporthe amygdali]